jgi:uncharacterized membrane protein YphA (DoxX/SURF4 family)
VTVSGSGGTVTVDGTPVTSDLSYYVYDALKQVTLEAVPAQGYRFVSWTGSEFDSASSITIYMNCNINIQANFSPVIPILTLNTHGHGTILPAPGEYPHPPGTVINLKATPDKGWKFNGWTPNVSDPKSAETSLTLNSDTQVTAGFSLVWTAWMILGIIFASLILAGILGWLIWSGFRHRKKLKNTFTVILRSGYTSLVFRLILGGIFIFAGFAKIHNISALVNEINEYQILPQALASLYGHILPWAEIIIGVLLVLGIALRITAGIASLMLISFTVSKIAALAMHLNIRTCDCFGLARPLLSSQSLAIDIVMLLLAAQIIIFRKELRSIPWPKLRKKSKS